MCLPECQHCWSWCGLHQPDPVGCDRCMDWGRQVSHAATSSRSSAAPPYELPGGRILSSPQCRDEFLKCQIRCGCGSPVGGRGKAGQPSAPTSIPHQKHPAAGEYPSSHANEAHPWDALGVSLLARLPLNWVRLWRTSVRETAVS